MQDIDLFIASQLASWPLAEANHSSLRSALTRKLRVGGLDVIIQHNPCRIVSSTARIDRAALESRPCFLCREHRQKEQTHIPFTGPSGLEWRIQLNPFPIFPNHLVIARDAHVPQSALEHLPDMISAAGRCEGYTIYYNGPMSGASAPDHLHFQACPRHILPLEDAVDRWMDSPSFEPLATACGARMGRFPGYTTGIYCFSSADAASLTSLFRRFHDAALAEGTAPSPSWVKDPDVPAMPETEPRMNLYAWRSEGEFRVMAILRTEIRSRHYYAEGPGHLTISPGAAEMAGVFVAPVEDDFRKVTAEQIECMLSDVSVSSAAQSRIDSRMKRTQSTIEVGIMAAPEIEFTLAGSDAPLKVTATPGGLMLEGPSHSSGPFPELLFEPGGAHSFVLNKVTIGIDFHWQQQRDLCYSGTLKFIRVGDRVQAINILGLEDYLLSVISSEMKSSASLNLLKAHAVISRSWCLARINERRRYLEGDPSVDPDKLPHTLFDVCADDHCQRYQGIGMAVGETVRKAIDQTWGEVLRYNGELVDARYSKCCGGTTELFSTCWEDIDPPYLQSFRDTPASSGAHGRGLKSSPYRGTEGVERDVAISDIFCDCEDNKILSQVLNDYDLETRDFYRWEQRYSRAELSELVHRRTGIDFGTILSLEPVETGPSGRIKYLRITGTLRTEVIGKELAIRRALSESHLKSSAFEVIQDGGSVLLKGRGWGHGVGLCQIGAAVMADRGYDYREILKHYYRGATIEQ